MFLHVGASLATNFRALGNDEKTAKAESPTKARPRWKKWLKRLGFGVLGLFVLLALFHRPIFFEATRYFVLRAAKQQNLDLDYEMRGSIFTTLSVVNLQAKPTEPGPIQRLEVGTLNLTYSLWDLIRDGLPAFLKELDVRNVFVELTPGEPLPPAKDAKPQAFKFPALFPELLNLENVNVVVHAPTGDTVLDGLFFSLLPDRPGSLKIKNLDISGVRRWTGIAAATTYRDRNLILTDLLAGPEIALQKFQLDMSELEKNELRVAMEGTFFNAPMTLSGRVTDLNATNQLTLNAEVKGLTFQPVWDYLHLTVPARGELEQLAVSFEGEPTRPASWHGLVKAQLKELELDGRALGDVQLETTLTSGRAKVLLTDQLDEKNSLRVTAEGALPETLDGFLRTKAEGQVELKIPQAGLLALPEPLAGDVAAKVDFRMADGLLSAKGALDSASLAAAGTDLTETHFTFDLEKDLTAPTDAPIFHSLATNLDGGVASVRFQDYQANALRIKLSSRDGRVSVTELALEKDGNSALVAADYLLPDDMKSWAGQPLKLDLAVDAPRLDAFLAPEAGTKLKGRVKITGKGEVRDRVGSGDFTVEGTEIEANGLPVRRINASINVAENRARIAPLEIVLDDKNRIQGEGEVQLGEALTYGGKLNVQLADLSLFQPLFGQDPKAPKLAGKLKVFWKGNGNARTSLHSGTASLDLTDGQFGDRKNLTAHFNASYAPDYINVPDFLATSDLGDAIFSLFWKDDRLSVTNLKVQQKKLTLVEGALEIPFRLSEARNLERLIPPNESLTLSLRTKDLNLRTVFVQLGEKNPPLLGILNLEVTAQGTLDELQGKVNLQAAGLQSTAADELAPASISLDLTLEKDRLNLDGIVRQKLVEPMRISGNLPFDAAAILQKRELDPQTPVDLRVVLPRSSLAFLPTLAPVIRLSRGTAAVDVRAGGTIAKPELSGSVTADLEALRFIDPSLPPLNAFGLRLSFAGDQMKVERCAGGIAGGSFQAGGSVKFAPMDNPALDLRIGARNALVLQNDNMTARVSSDLRVSGRFNAGSVQGTVWVTRSRFFKNIDILPIGLPGRPAPQPPADPVRVSFPNPPLRDWKFDIAIRTADPFLVQSNLATGSIVMDLRLGGTGRDPWMDGVVTIEELTASLPFSRLNIRSGLILFTQRDPFVPQLNLRGTSTIRDYNISVFITGPVTDPEALFTSEPPLPQAEVVSLIATGMTTTELGRDPNALAGRAAVLVFQRLYNSAFRRNKPPSKNESLLSRIQFDIGATDPKSGRQATTLGVPLSDQIMLSGGLDVGGNFRGQVRYLIRFK